eukprot:RCo047328
MRIFRRRRHGMVIATLTIATSLLFLSATMLVPIRERPRNMFREDVGSPLPQDTTDSPPGLLGDPLETPFSFLDTNPPKRAPSPPAPEPKEPNEPKELDSAKPGLPRRAPVYAPLPSASGSERQQQVREAMVHSWKAYREYLGHDEIHPLTGGFTDWRCDCPGEKTGLGLTLIDALDTLWLMDLKPEFNEAVRWISTELSFHKNMQVSVFETTIRFLGGLLGAYELSGVPILLTKAQELGDVLMYAFGESRVFPFPLVNLQTHHTAMWGWTPNLLLAEVATLQLEFRTLSLLTGNPRYDQKVTAVMTALYESSHIPGQENPGALPPLLSDSGVFRDRGMTLGAFGDSAYEYLLKQWVLTGDKLYLKMYTDAAALIRSKLVRKSSTGHTFIGVLEGDGRFVSAAMDQLVCYAGGMFALASYYGLGDDLALAEELAEGCHFLYNSTATGLGADSVHWNLPGALDPTPYTVSDAKWILRPETVETYFYLYRITGKKMYQEWGWEFFQACQKWARVERGYAGITDVRDGSHKNNKMESFWLAETLKYLYLLFGDQRMLPLDDWGLNTEAH